MYVFACPDFFLSCLNVSAVFTSGPYYGKCLILGPMYADCAPLVEITYFLSAYLRTALLHNAAYEQGPNLEVPIYAVSSILTMLPSFG